ncbi:hypothetical protein KR093_001748 [Drosophila rubida]|uniref:Citrate transporter-like domain-containing protein n=1 Tax=Drosophila rubida TaxID=30044 RepID=A0AAD4K4G7_9MUSC|nr:hypothetical protein KR093_001748 [Drosophila rubida]
MAVRLRRHHPFFSEQQLRREKWLQTLRVIKRIVFVGIWVFFTILICQTPTVDLQTDVVSLSPQLPHLVRIQNEAMHDAVRVMLYGSINVLKTLQPERLAKSAQYVVVSVIHNGNRTNETAWRSAARKVYVYRKFLKVGSVSIDFKLKEGRVGHTKLHVSLCNQHNESLGMLLSIHANPINRSLGICCGLVLMVLLYLMLVSNVLEPIFAAWLVAFSALGVLCFEKSRPALSTIVSWVEMETLGLLFATMIMVGILSETGLFDYLSVLAYQLSRGNAWLLLFNLCLVASVFSMALDNSSTFTLLMPVTARLCETLQLNTMVVLISIALFANIGDSLTPIGDTPNAIIANDDHVTSHGITFLQFAMHMFPGAICAMFVSWIMLYFLIRNQLFKSTAANPLRATRFKLLDRQRVSDLRLTAEKIQHLFQRLLQHQKHQDELRLQLYKETLGVMKARYRIRDKPLLIKCGVGYGFAICMFMLQSLPLIRNIKLSWAAVVSAILLVILVNEANTRSILGRVEWTQLVYLAALYVLIECLVVMGFLDWLGDLTTGLISSVDESNQLAVSILLIMWTSALGSAFVDNAPITTMMLKVVSHLSFTNNLPFTPMIWALSFGVCFGNNCNLIGASPRFISVSLPITVATVTVASAYLLIAHCYFQWHAEDDTLKIQ